jgi:hypothetical protein
VVNPGLHFLCALCVLCVEKGVPQGLDMIGQVSLMSQQVICNAIANRSVIQFSYNLSNQPGIRTVEPHMVAYNQKGHLALSAWLLHGNSESNEVQGWREYLFSGISDITVLPEKFSRPRDGYNPTGGDIFNNIQCRF